MQLADQMGPKEWVLAGIVGAIIFALLVEPIREKVAAALGRAVAKPLIEAHDEDPRAHADLLKALALVAQSQEDLQRQLKAQDERRREAIDAIQGKLDLAIRLMESSK